MQWVKLPTGLLRGPALSLCSLAARGLFAILFSVADQDGAIPLPEGVNSSQWVRSYAYDPTDPDAGARSLKELTRFRLVVETDSGVVIPSRAGVGIDGRAPGRRVARWQDLDRAKPRTSRGHEATACNGCNGCNGTPARCMQRRCNGDATGCNGPCNGQCNGTYGH